MPPGMSVPEEADAKRAAPAIALNQGEGSHSSSPYVDGALITCALCAKAR